MFSGIGLYKRLSRIKWLRSYSSKFLFIAFIGLQIPLLGISGLMTLAPSDNLPGISVLSCALIFTCIATLVTIYLMRHLLNPVRLLQRSLQDFVTTRKLPDLPREHDDDMGILMKEMQNVLLHLNQLMETKNDVIELISHDLRSPASSMLGLIGVLETTRSHDRELMDYCEKLKLLVSKQLQLTNGILDSLKQEESLREGSTEKVAVKKLCDSALRAYADDIKQKGIEVVSDVPAQLTINTDQLQMQQVLNNLVHNAVKFSHRGGKIWVKAKQENDKVKLSISDNGIGMENVSPELLFKRFTKYSRTGTYGEHSSGLGLFICRKIIEKNGGSITVTSEGTNKGTTFIISLPLSAIALFAVILPHLQ